jgi:hypothetical protein
MRERLQENSVSDSAFECFLPTNCVYYSLMGINYPIGGRYDNSGLPQAIRSSCRKGLKLHVLITNTDIG